MKHYLLFLVACLLVCVNSQAQDLIYIKGQKKPESVKVLEIGLEEVKYRPQGDTSGPILVYARYNLDKVILSNGSVFEFKQAQAIGSPIDYATQRKDAVKVNFLSPLWGHLAFSYEHSLGVGRSVEGGLSFVGLGINQSAYYDDVDPNPIGTTIRVGYKFINSPDFYIPGMRYAHILKGGYIKPEVTLSVYGISRGSNDYYYYSTRNTVERRTVVASAVMVNFGKQWVFDDKFLFDFYIGVGMGFCNYANLNMDYPEVYHYGFSVIPVFPLATTGGLRFGYLLESSAPKKAKD